MGSVTAKRGGRVLAAVLTALLLAGCAAGPGAVDTAEAASAIAASQPDLQLYEAGPADTNFRTLLERVYAVDPDSIEDGCVLYSEGVSASEIAVLQCTDAQAAQKAAAALEQYADQREAAFAGYAPEEADIAASAQVVREGSTVMLIMVPDQAAARQAASAFLPGGAAAAPASTSVPSAPEETVEASGSYDHDAVLAAVISGSADGLSSDNQQVADTVRSVLDALISEDMTPYEKEAAIHDWMTANIQYDPAELSHPLLGAVPEPNNDNPIGALLQGKAICYGYSSTFQLFMDALGIPCITIDGKANASAEPHSWNAVELDGQWYYVDVTWDDPVTRQPHRNYLNQTAAYLEEHGPHIWDREGLPETASEPYSTN